MSKKGDARVARRLANELKVEEKSARLRTIPSAHTVRSEYEKDVTKGARAGANPSSVMQMPMIWSAEDADLEGAWTWGVNRDWGQATWDGSLLPKLQQFEKLSWAEIEAQQYGNEGKRHRAHHSMDTVKICDEAQYRLMEIERETEVLFRFRLGNLPRLWGIRVVNKFEILWYDPSHEIYPVGS